MEPTTRRSAPRRNTTEGILCIVLALSSGKRHMRERVTSYVAEGCSYRVCATVARWPTLRFFLPFFLTLTLPSRYTFVSCLYLRLSGETTVAERRKRIGCFDAVAPWLPAAPKRRISSPSRARALLIAPLTPTCVAILIVSRVRIPRNHVRRATDASRLPATWMSLLVREAHFFHLNLHLRRFRDFYRLSSSGVGAFSRSTSVAFCLTDRWQLQWYVVSERILVLEIALRNNQCRLLCCLYVSLIPRILSIDRYISLWEIIRVMGKMIRINSF